MSNDKEKEDLGYNPIRHRTRSNNTVLGMKEFSLNDDQKTNLSNIPLDVLFNAYNSLAEFEFGDGHGKHLNFPSNLEGKSVLDYLNYLQDENKMVMYTGDTIKAYKGGRIAGLTEHAKDKYYKYEAPQIFSNDPDTLYLSDNYDALPEALKPYISSENTSLDILLHELGHISEFEPEKGMELNHLLHNFGSYVTEEEAHGNAEKWSLETSLDNLLTKAKGNR